MLSDTVRTTVRMAKTEIIKILDKLPLDTHFDIYQKASYECTFLSDAIMHTGIHFDLGDLSAVDDLTRGSFGDLDSLIRQLNILGIGLPYPRMSLNVSVNVDRLSEDAVKSMSKKFNYSPEAIRQALNPHGIEKTNFSFLVETISEGIILGVTWFKHGDPEDLIRWGYTPYCSLISLYNDFKDIALPPPEIFDNKGLSFLNEYRDQIEQVDSCIINLPISSPVIRRKNFKGNDESYIRAEGHEKDNVSLLEMELFRFLFLLNTKGVGFQTITPDVKKNKRRQKQNQYPLLAYKVLKVDNLVIGKNPSLPSEDADGSAKRVHTCRGHIKVYTIEKPLLGHTSGPVWVRPHMRGKASGVILKDYALNIK